MWRKSSCPMSDCNMSKYIVNCCTEHLTIQNLFQEFYVGFAWPIREGNGTPLQSSCLENPMDGGSWWAAVHGVSESDTTEWRHFHVSLSFIGEGNGNHSSVLAWRIPGTGEPGGLSSMGSHRVGHDWSDLSSSSLTNASVLISWFSKHIYFF